MYDVIIVGAGISGAIIAKKLVKAGKRVLMLEAGEPSDNWQDYQSFIHDYKVAEAKVPNSPYTNNPNAPQPSVLNTAGFNTVEKPDTKGYFVQQGPMAFTSDYTRYIGGTTLHWLGTCLRMLPVDFKLQDNFGHGLNWPITYDELQPYYEKAEFEIGVSANVEEQSYLGVHFSPDYVYPMHKIPQSYCDQFFIKNIDGLNVKYKGFSYPISVTSTPQGRNSMPNEHYDFGNGYTPIGAVSNSELGQRCEGNTSCVPICPVQAKYNANKTLEAVKKQSNFELRTRSVVSKLIYQDNSRQITGVEYKSYVSKQSPAHTTHIVKAKLVVLACHAVENAKLLLASGIKSTSGLVGCNLMDHPSLLTWGLTPDKVFPFRGPVSTSGIESMRTGKFRHQHSAFRVDMGNDGWGWSTGAPYPQLSELIFSKKLIGRQLRKSINDDFTRQCRFGFLIEQTAQASNRVTIDEKYKDQLGNYRPIINYEYSDYEKQAFAAARQISNKVFAHAGIKDCTSYSIEQTNFFEFQGENYWVTGAGHLAGTHIMGTSAQNSVVDRRQRSWDFDNLFLTGCGNMPSMGTSNPTLTMSALSFWAADNILEDLQVSSCCKESA